MSERIPRDDLRALLGDMQAIASPLQEYLEDLHRQYRPLRDGVVASYIPELATANPDWFAICIATVDGRLYQIGDFNQPFTVQSVSKPFLYGMALQEHGRDNVLKKIGVEPTGEAFNAIVLDEESKRPYNPMVNAGAIATADLIGGADPTERLKRVLGLFRAFAAREILMDAAVFTSERTTGHRNRAIAHLMHNFDMIGPGIDATLDLYFQQCSLLVTCRDLAVMGATLANGGVNPISGERALAQEYVQDVLSVMYTCGMYDFSGEWSYRVGMPAKSGVSGGIVAVAPGRMGIGVFSPLLDQRGNSVRGVRVCADLSRRFGLHLFAPPAAADSFHAAANGRTAL
jgi:glutaminase